MAEEDDAQKTEEPTSRKLEQAHGKGQTAVSQELKHFGMLITVTLVIAILAPMMIKDLRALLIQYLDQGEAIPLDLENLRDVFSHLIIGFFKILAPILGAIMLAGLAFSVAQSGWVWAPSKVAPEISKISIIKGLGRMFSAKSLFEFVKGILKLLVVTGVAVAFVLPFHREILLLPGIEFISTFSRMHLIVIWFFAGAAAVMGVIAVMDYLYQKYTFIQQMRMTKQEVKDEHKQSEGDPLVKGRIRQLRAERAQQRMMAAVPGADVVVTNPTHFAVALNYNIEQMQAPILVAKGQDFIALKMREVAEENDVPIVENPPLARALFAAVEIDEEIPMEHYQAVAEVIGYVMRLRGDKV